MLPPQKRPWLRLCVPLLPCITSWKLSVASERRCIFPPLSLADGVYSQRAAEANLLGRGSQGHRLRADAAHDGRSQMGHQRDNVTAQHIRRRPVEGNCGHLFIFLHLKQQSESGKVTDEWPESGATFEKAKGSIRSINRSPSSISE